MKLTKEELNQVIRRSPWRMKITEKQLQEIIAQELREFELNLSPDTPKNPGDWWDAAQVGRAAYQKDIDLVQTILIAQEECGMKEGSPELNDVIAAWQESETQKLPKNPEGAYMVQWKSIYTGGTS